MLHARLFSETQKFRDAHFQPVRELSGGGSVDMPKYWLDGNSATDRPLFVQFCANKPNEFLEAARHVAPYCDAVDLNLGCPQGIARSGHYGAFLQEDWKTIYEVINTLHQELPVPVTAKIRVLESKEKTLEYAKMILSAGASIIAVHGRRREQKGHNMGVADWTYIRYLRDNLPSDTVIFANGNILNRKDVQPCLDATGADAVLSAEGNLSDPTIFAKLPSQPSREYWVGRNGQEGFRIDGVVRRYFDIIYRDVLEVDPPPRPPLYSLLDRPPEREELIADTESNEPPSKKHRRDQAFAKNSPNLRVMQGHLFQILRPMLSTHTHIRDALAKTRVGDMAGFENVLRMLEEAVKKGLGEYELAAKDEEEMIGSTGGINEDIVKRYKRPWFICQPHVRPLPEEALRNGALKLSKKELAKTEIDQGTREVAFEKPDDLSGMKTSALVCG